MAASRRDASRVNLPHVEELSAISDQPDRALTADGFSRVNQCIARLARPAIGRAGALFRSSGGPAMPAKYDASDALRGDLAPRPSQIVSDVYRTMQSRLDGYRQGAAAIFLGVVAAVVTIDLSFARLLIDRIADAQHLDALLRSRLALAAVLGVAIIPILTLVSGCVIIGRVGAYFAEMSSIVYKIEEIYQLWEPGAWVKDVALLPKKFREVRDVGVHPDDAGLLGWSDPAIGLFVWALIALAFAHAGLYLYLIEEIFR
jgi:hypothetical protein